MKQILIVDDEYLIRYSMSAVFQNKDAEIITSSNGKSALKMLSDRRFDFCFLDIQLPDMSGMDILKMVRQLSPQTKVIMMTGSVVDAASLQVIRERAYLFLPKPFDLLRVKRVLDALPAQEANIFQQLDELEARVAADRRTHRRQSAVQPVIYVTTGAGSGEEMHSADLLDISDAGTRIRTEHCLDPGSRVRFRNSLSEASGIVRWSENDEQNRFCLAGIQFVGRESR
jgi:CheY-like chemotaxis protein